MADYEGRVILRADISQATREVDNFARRIESRPVRVAIDTAGILQARQSLAQLQRSIGELNKTPLNILAPGRGAQADIFRQLAQAGKEFYDGIISGNRQLASTTAGLRQQAVAFRNLADNINFSDKAQQRFFRNFVQGAEMARTKSIKAGLQEVVALQDLYQKGVSGLGQNISSRAGGLEQLLSLGKDLPRTKAALSEYRDELSRVYDLVETRSLSGGIISLEISNVEKELLKIENDRLEALDQINNVKKAEYSLTGKQLFLEEEHLAGIERRTAATNELIRAQRQQATDIYNRDRALSRDFGVNPTRTLRPAGVSDELVALRNLIATQSRLNAIEEENLAAVERRIGARQAEIAVANELVKLQRQQATDIYNRDRALSRDFGVNPSRALRPAGVTDEEVALRNLIATQSRLNAIEEENLAAVERRIGARQAEIAVANRLASLQYQQTVDAYNRGKALSKDFGVNPAMTLLPAGMSSQDVAKRNTISDRTRAAAEASAFNAFSRRASEIQNDLPVLKSIERNREKIEAETAREAQAAARNANRANAAGRSAELRRTQGMSFEKRLARKRPDLAPGGKRAPGFFRGNLRQALGEGLIGGAFPALFGQGVAASVGGAVGGIAGGAVGGTFGFGLALVGTALGQAVDTTAKNLSDLAVALKSPGDAIKALETNGYRVSDSLKFQVEQLQAVGRGYDAQTLVLKEVRKRLGPGSIAELQQLDSANKKLQEQWSAIGSEIHTRLLPVLQGFVEFLGAAAGDISGFSSQSRLQRIDPARFEELRGLAIEQTSGPLGMFGDKKAYEARLSELSKQELAKRFTREGDTVSLSPQEKFADETTRIQKSRKIADQIQSTYREAFNLQRQAHDLQRDGATLNKEIADYTYRKEREIFDLRQQVAERQIENVRAAAQNRIESGDLSARQTFAAAVGFEQQLLGNVREVVRARKEGEADIEQSRNRLELAMARLNRDVEDYKRTNAREIEDIERRKLAYVRSVEDYKMRVADYVLERSRQSADLVRQAMALPEGGGIGETLPGGSNAEKVASALMSRLGLNKAQASGVIGNFMRESGGNLEPKINEGGKIGAPVGKGGYGIAQWTGQRQKDLVRFAGSPEKAGDLSVQIDFLIRELTTTENRALRSLKSAKTPEEAAVAFERDFERAGIKALEERKQNARRFFNSTGPSIAAGDSIAAAEQAASRLNGIANSCVEAVKIFMRSIGFNASAMDSSAKSAERMGQVMTDWSQLKPGDIVARGSVGSPQHVGVFTGGESVFHHSRSRGLRAGNFPDLGYFKQNGYFIRPSGMNAQSAGALQVSAVPRPRFDEVPIGPTPSAAPINAARLAAATAMGGNEKEAQRILEEGIKLKQKGIELGQIEAILQTNQLPQLQQQGDALKQQIEARQKIVNLSDNAASIADIEAESRARLKQIEATRVSALAQVQKQYKGDVTLIKQVNQQAGLAAQIAKGEEDQRRANLELNNKLQSSDQARLQILQLQEGVAISKVELAALERRELQAGAVELLKASTLYQQSDEAQKSTLVTLTAQTEELQKQRQFMERLVGLQLDATYAGAGLRSGRIGAEARAFEQGLKENKGDIGKATALANATRAAEDRQMVWGNLEKDIVNASNAISGGLTDGLLDIVSGAKQIEDVGRDMLDTIARSFADSAQQQLATLLQRQFAGMIGGSIGAGATAAGPQALNGASLTAAGSLGFLNNAALALGATLQTIAGQSALYGQMGGGSGLAGLFSGASGLLGFSSSIPQLAPALESVPNFAGFFANGGTLRQGEFGVVGEKEPEFFFPGVTGTVVPRSTVEKAAELRQANQAPGKIDLSYTVTEQRGERYVTEEQFRKGMARTAQQTQAMFVSSVRQNRSVRDSMGL